MNNSSYTPPPLCQLTPAQTQAALRLKRAAIAKFTSEGCPQAVPCDYEIALHSLADETDDASKVLKKMEGLYYMRQEYGVQDTLAQAIESVNQVMEEAPGLILHFEQRLVERNHIQDNNHNNDANANPNHQVNNQAPNPPWAMARAEQRLDDELPPLHQHPIPPREPPKTHGVYIMDVSCTNLKWAYEHTRPYALLVYYLYHASYVNLDAFREGHVSIVEAEGVKDHEDFAKIASKVGAELASFYPLRYKGIHTFNSASEYNIAYQAFRQDFPDIFQDNFKLGCRSVGQTACSVRALFAPAPTPLLAQNVALLVQQVRQIQSYEEQQQQHQEQNALDHHHNLPSNNHYYQQLQPPVTFWPQFVAAMELRLRNQAAFRLPPLTDHDGNVNPLGHA